jgi:protein-S-isoprenylcysteine O-methyltransferase Ste14
MTKWGIGLKLFISALFTAALTLGISFWFTALFNYPLEIRPFQAAAGILLTAFGVVFWIMSVALVMKAYKAHRLCTEGTYSLCRHPVYSAWIVFIIPGLSLLINTWLLLLASLAMYLTLRRDIPAEDTYLEKEFGADYRSYSENVPAVIPLGRLLKKR